MPATLCSSAPPAFGKLSLRRSRATRPCGQRRYPPGIGRARAGQTHRNGHPVVTSLRKFDVFGLGGLVDLRDAGDGIQTGCRCLSGAAARHSPRPPPTRRIAVIIMLSPPLAHSTPAARERQTTRMVGREQGLVNLRRYQSAASGAGSTKVGTDEGNVSCAFDSEPALGQEEACRNHSLFAFRRRAQHVPTGAATNATLACFGSAH